MVFDIASGNEALTLIGGKEQKIKKEDIVLRSGPDVLISHLFGPGDSTKITDKTVDALYLFWFAEHISDREIDSIVQDFKRLLSLIQSEKSTIETFEVQEAGSEFIVTPWDVKGNIDYDKLVRQFGTKKIDEPLLKDMKAIAGEDHYFLKRKIFYSHMYLDEILKSHKKGEKFYLYTGRAPSGPVHLGHIIPWLFTKWLQEKFDATLLFQIPDEEKFLFKDNLTLDDTRKWAYENILDIIALGFDPKKTKIFLDTEYAGHMYKHACVVSKKITYSTIKSTFGFESDRNIGEIFYTAMQSVPVLLPSVMEGKKTRVLIPCAIDQDVHFRLTRDVAESLGYYKPATILCRFLPGLQGMGEEGKMSSSAESTAIYTHDDPKIVKNKILKYAFSGGRDTVEEHRKLGGNPEIDVAYQWLTFFEEDDAKLEKIYKDYKSGKLLSGELKMLLVDKINNFLTAHREKKEKAKKEIEKFMLRD
ncbi:MAG: tryptophan--tRNA ligase [Nanoarchaeota archaeon]|nr:tryptophan--tRNA ligase [Nanoarchaeota archaeon]